MARLDPKQTCCSIAKDSCFLEIPTLASPRTTSVGAGAARSQRRSASLLFNDLFLGTLNKRDHVEAPGVQVPEIRQARVVAGHTDQPQRDGRALDRSTAFKHCTTMKVGDVTATLDLALQASGLDRAKVVHLRDDRGLPSISKPEPSTSPHAGYWWYWRYFLGESQGSLM